MAKRLDREDEPNEFMEAPCRCDCGKWFDLEDGYRSEKPGSSRVICGDCHDEQQAIVDQIATSENELYLLNSNDRKPERRKKLEHLIEELRDQLSRTH